MTGLVLVVEDNPPLRKVVGITLRMAGYRVLEAADGREALAHASRELPTVVLQDQMLPDIEAIELLRALRTLPGGAQLPVIAVSGSSAKLDRTPGATVSFTDHLLKPVEPQRLLSTVAKYAAPERLDDALGAGRELLLVDDDLVQRKLARLLLERIGFRVSVAGDGVEGLHAARAAPPDVIVSDVLMPRLDGFQLCRQVREDPVLRAVPVVLMSSAYVEEEDRQLAQSAGATALLERAPDLDELVRTLTHDLSSASPVGPADLDFAVAHPRRVMRQLELQVAANAELTERLALKSAELSVLAGMASVLTRSVEAADMLEDVLARCLEAGGLCAGVALLYDDSGKLTRVADVGPAPSVAALRARLARIRIEQGSQGMGEISELPSDATGHPAIAVRLGTAPEPLGLIAIGWGGGVVDEPRIAFARTLSGQLSETIALRHAIVQLDLSREETITRLALAAEFRDDDTARHTERVSRCSGLLAERLGLDPRRVELIRVASVLHDVGKIGVADAILLKPGPLTSAEFEQMKQHAAFGHRILTGSHVELLELAATIALTHHERVDGTGYPVGLSGEQIPLAGRIVAVADVFDALTSHRVYRPAMSVESALETMRAGRGTQFDSEVLDQLLDSLDAVLAIRTERNSGPGRTRAASRAPALRRERYSSTV